MLVAPPLPDPTACQKSKSVGWKGAAAMEHARVLVASCFPYVRLEHLLNMQVSRYRASPYYNILYKSTKQGSNFVNLLKSRKNQGVLESVSEVTSPSPQAQTLEAEHV